MSVLLAAVAGLVVLLTTILTGLGFSGVVLPGPLPGSPFARMGTLVSSLGPLLLVVTGLVGTSWRERSSGYALSAGLLTGISAMGGYALAVVLAEGEVRVDHLVFISFLGSAVFASGGLAWMAARTQIGGGRLLWIQAWLGLAVVLLVTLTLVPDLLFSPVAGFAPTSQHTLALGAVALLLSAASAAWHAQRYARRRRIDIAGFSAFSAGILAACLARPYDTPGWWLSYCVLTGLWSLAAVVVVVGGSLLPGPARRWVALFPAGRTRRWAAVLSLLLTLLSLLHGFDTSLSRFVAHGAALSAALLCGAVALWYRRGGFANASGLLFTLAVFESRLSFLPDVGAVALLAVSVGLALSATFWLVIELPQLQQGTTLLRWRGVRYAPLATTAALGLLVCTAAFALLADAGGRWTFPVGAAGWLAAIAVGLALGVAVWARQTTFALPEQYILGLGMAGLVVHACRPTPEQLTWMAPLALACHVGLASLVGVTWRQLVGGTSLTADRFQLSHPVIPERQWDWLLPSQLLFAALALLLAVIAAVSHLPLGERLMGPVSAALLALACVGMAHVAPPAWAERLRLTALALVPATLGLLAWAVPEPATRGAWLERNAWLLFALAASALAGLEALRNWPAARRLSLVVGGLAAVVLLLVVAQMVPHYDKVLLRTSLSVPAIAAVLIALLALLASALRLALRPGHDPLGLSESWRTLYVYLAEVLLVLLFVHVRLNIPILFLGALAKYWVFAVLLAAFVGVGLGEWCERRGLRVLAIPLARTGVFLPLLPVLAFWAKPPAALLAFADSHAPGMLPLLGYFDKLPRHFEGHALVWFLTSALYMLLALSRRSSSWALLAAMAANFGFWAVLASAGISFFVHPQAWLIPLALILLAAEYLHREQLGPQASETLRYMGVSLIYVASTADLFLAGLGNSLWLPIVLAALCVAGAGAGILLRVRAFLFLGVGFLLVDVLSMIWHAAVDRAHTWLWWASGIVLGAGILAVFAVFEKRRDEVLKVFEELKQWD